MRSPSEQLSEGQPGASELLINPDAEKIVHSHPRRQTCSQSLKLLGHGAAPATDQRCSTELVVEKLSLRFWRMEATHRLRPSGAVARLIGSATYDRANGERRIAVNVSGDSVRFLLVSGGGIYAAAHSTI
jgi:hypothetical protein